MDEVERDIENYWGRGWRYLPKPQAEADNANRGLNNSRYPAKTEFNNYFIIHMDCFIIHMDYFIIHMGWNQNNDLITTKKSNKVTQDKMFSKQ